MSYYEAGSHTFNVFVPEKLDKKILAKIKELDKKLIKNECYSLFNFTQLIQNC